MSDVIATNQTILVVGGGISGVTAAIEAAECGKQVILIEKNPSLGGRVSQLYKYFPKLCFPSCGMEINLRRVKANRNLNILTMTEVSAVSGETGNYSVTLKTAPRFVNDNCTMPVVHYSTLMSVAYGKSGKEAGLDGQMIKAKQLEAIAGK